MKIVVSATGETVDDRVHEFFGRCDFLIVFDLETRQAKAVKNDNLDAVSGAGTGCAQVVFDEGAETVISGKVGPKAYEALQGAGIGIYLSPPEITVAAAIEKYEQGSLRKMEIQKF